jgi:hypothetical protein
MDVVKTFDFNGKQYEIRRNRENEKSSYAVFQGEKRANGYTYTSYDLDLIPTDAELIAFAEADIRNGICEQGLTALRQAAEKR